MRRGSLHVEVLAAGDPVADAELDRFLEQCPASVAQQTPGWRNVITSLGADQAMFLGCRQGEQLVGVLPGYRFEGPLGAILSSCAQAGPLGGVACLPEADREAVYEALLEAFLQISAASGCVAATVISNPFWTDLDLCRRFLQPDYVLENVCQVLDIQQALDAEGNFVNASPKLRYNLRRSQRQVLHVDDRQTADNLAAWYAIHRARHRELGIEQLPEAMFWRALEELIPRDKGRFLFARHSETGELVSGALFIYHGQVMDMVIASGRSDYARFRPNYLIPLHAMRWARQRGIRYFNWQGSPPDSGVHRYKLGWGSRDVTYGYLTRVTGKVEPLLCSTVERVRSAYRWHYVLPFDQIGHARSDRPVRSTRVDAWRKQESASP